MLKLVVRLVAFLIFFCITATLIVFILLASLGWIDAQRLFPGLPEPPAIDTGKIPGDPFGGLEIPADLRPGEIVPLRGQVRPFPLFAAVPLLRQLSTDPRVIGTNLFLAIIMALVFGATSSILSNMLRDEEPRVQAWLHAFGITGLVRRLSGMASWTLGRGVRRGCLTLPLVLLIFALYGVIFAFLERGTSIFSREGVLLAVTLAFSVGLVSSAGDIARRIVAALWREPSHFSLYPVNLAVAAITVAISRVANLSPGIVFGTPGGAEVGAAADPLQQAQRDRALGAMTLIVLITLALLGWALTGLVVSALDITLEYRVARLAAAALTSLANIGLAVFLIALQTTFFEMLPFAYSSGQPIFRWSKAVWALGFVPVAFIFSHALINPRYGFLESFLESDVRFLWFIMVVLVAVTGGLWFYFNVIDDMLQDWAGIRRRPASSPPERSRGGTG